MNNEKINKSDRIANILTQFLGSWNFILFQILIIAIWIFINVSNLVRIDEFPFVFLNLALSFQAAFTAPIILMSQNRQAKSDREVQQVDFLTDKKAEKEIQSILQELKTIKELLKNK
jgi:uncharacterized membrane protein